MQCMHARDFPGSSDGKKSACNAGDLSLIAGLWRSPGEGLGYPVQYSWTFLVAQRSKHLPAMPGTWVQSLGWEYPLEKEMATHSSILAWKIPWTEDPSGLQSTGSQRVRHNLATSLLLSANVNSNSRACSLKTENSLYIKSCNWWWQGFLFILFTGIFQKSVILQVVQ